MIVGQGKNDTENRIYMCIPIVVSNAILIWMDNHDRNSVLESHKYGIKFIVGIVFIYKRKNLLNRTHGFIELNGSLEKYSNKLIFSSFFPSLLI